MQASEITKKFLSQNIIVDDAQLKRVSLEIQDAVQEVPGSKDAFKHAKVVFFVYVLQ